MNTYLLPEELTINNILDYIPQSSICRELVTNVRQVWFVPPSSFDLLGKCGRVGNSDELPLTPSSISSEEFLCMQLDPIYAFSLLIQASPCASSACVQQQLQFNKVEKEEEEEYHHYIIHVCLSSCLAVNRYT